MSRRGAVLAILLFLAPLPECRVLGKEAGKDTLRAYVVRKQGRQAYGVYIGKSKVGWLVEEFKFGKYQGKEVALQASETHLVENSGGEKSVTHETSVTYFSLEGEGPILGIEEYTREDNTKTQRTAVRGKNALVIISRTRKRRAERSVPFPKETLGLMRKLDRWLEGKPAPGTRFEYYSTDLEQKNISVKEIHTFREKKTILWAGVRTEVFIVRVRTQGELFDVTLKTDGTLLRGRRGGLMELRAEKEAIAKKLDSKGVDLLAAASIFVDRRLGPAEKIASLTIEASGHGDFVFPSSHRQRVRKGKKGTVILDLTRDRPVKNAVPLKEVERKEHLEATPAIQSDDSALRKLAKKIVSQENDPVKRARLLQRWVHKNLRKSYAANASTALDVLDNRAGDCSEHTLLYVALARAAGIPAREISGIAYLDAKKPLFGWHAWAEIHDGRQWVSVDPTWNQVYTDVTHIKLSEGSEDLSWANMVGKLKLKIVRFEKKK